MDRAGIKKLLEGIRPVRAAVFGDFALDAYWMLDPCGSEVSVETGLQARAVRSHYYTPGGAAGVVANMLAMQPRSVLAIGVVGGDIFGQELLRLLAERGADTSGIVMQEEDFDTITFIKRILNHRELPRLDFGFCNRRSPETDRALLRCVGEALKRCDALVINQQVPGTLDDPYFSDEINRLASSRSDTVTVLDSRHRAGRFPGLCRKLNEGEAAELCGGKAAPGRALPVEDVRRYALQLYGEARKPVFITRGERGMVVADEAGLHVLPGFEFLQQTDPVGAGDAAAAAIALGLATGASAAECGELANAAAAVTAKKLLCAGTASPDEILALAEAPDLLYRPELADDISRAEYVKNTALEICVPLRDIAAGGIGHAVFDNDGTISLLRQGWEEVMEEMMVEAVMGGVRNVEDATADLVRRTVRDYIGRSTGIQTIVQMNQLAEMVRRFGIAPPNRIYSGCEYKLMYDERMMRIVDNRLKAIAHGSRTPEDFTVRGAIGFLEELKNRGAILYLVSGTDGEHVLREADALRCAHLFDGGVFGSVGDINRYSKAKIFGDITRKHGLSGPGLAAFGDGPVEIRECRKRGGTSVGIASDEVGGEGLNPRKRRRLIRAGAQIISPDFRWAPEILALLFG